jgi:hypothetical protein
MEFISKEGITFRLGDNSYHLRASWNAKARFGKRVVRSGVDDAFF